MGNVYNIITMALNTSAHLLEWYRLEQDLLLNKGNARPGNSVYVTIAVPSVENFIVLKHIHSYMDDSPPPNIVFLSHILKSLGLSPFANIFLKFLLSVFIFFKYVMEGTETVLRVTIPKTIIATLRWKSLLWGVRKDPTHSKICIYNEVSKRVNCCRYKVAIK